MKRGVGLVLAGVLLAAAPAQAQVVPGSSRTTSTATASAAAESFEFDLGLDAVATPPVERSGWFWAAASVVLVSGVLLTVLATRGGERCFCVGAVGNDCGDCR